jgi:hypothetical protein
MTFTDDLKFGNQYEQNCCVRLKNPKIMKGKFKAYDIIDEDGTKYEVKSDRWTFKTGNICIEFECNKKPSGISSTESDFYFYYVILPSPLEPILYKIPTSDIRTMVEEKKYNKIMNGGDGFRSKFYLFKEDLFTKYRV